MSNARDMQRQARSKAADTAWATTAFIVALMMAVMPLASHGLGALLNWMFIGVEIVGGVWLLLRPAAPARRRR